MNDKKKKMTAKPEFPDGRMPLADLGDIHQFIKYWKTVFQKRTGESENPDFPQMLLSKGFIYKRNELDTLILHHDYALAKQSIKDCNDICMLGDAIFTYWRVITHSDFFVPGREEYDCFLSLFDRIAELTEKDEKNDYVKNTT